MMTKKVPIFAAVLAGALLAFGGVVATKVHAAEGESIVLSPASERFEVDAGEAVRKTFTVINDGTVEFDFKVYATPYSVSDGSYLPNYEEKASNADVYTWVAFDQDRFTLQPGEKVDVPYTIDVPADAAPGGHYGVVFAETEAKEDNSGQISRNKRVGAILALTVEGETVLEGQQIGAQIDWLQLGGQINGLLTVENTGNTDFVMTDKITVNNILGPIAYEKQSERLILPKTTREVQLTWPNSPIMGVYKVSLQSELLGKTTTTTQWVLLMPAWMLVVSVVAIVGLIFFLIRRRR